MRELPRVFLLVVLLAVSLAARPLPSAEAGERALTLDGSVVVFVFPERAPGMVDPAGEFRTMPKDVGPQLEARGIKVVTTGPALIHHKSRDRRRQVDFRTTPSFVGTIFFKPQTEPEINRGLEKQGELMLRVDDYFGKKKQGDEKRGQRVSQTRAPTPRRFSSPIWPGRYGQDIVAGRHVETRT
jgi:hypothetical protein